MIEFSKVDATPLHRIAISLIICVIVATIITLIIGVLIKTLKIPNFIFEFIIKLTALISFFGMVFIVINYFY